MRKAFFLLTAFQAFILAAVCQVQLQNLQTENLNNPIGLDVLQPRFSWQLVSDKRNVLQTAYELKVSSDPKLSSSIWNTGKISSDQSISVPYQGPALTSGKRYYWQVRVWDNSGKASPWSAPSFFQMALLQPSDWKASWIVPGHEEDSLRASPMFRKEFNSNKGIRSATAYITAHGLYEATINGKRVGDAYFTPGWTSYNKRLQYQAYDVTSLLKQGPNAVAVTLGNGWYRSDFSFNNKNIYGKDIALLFQIDIVHTDGTTTSIVSDGSWKSSTGAIRFSEIYDGETIDARMEKKGWTSAGYNDAAWSAAKTADFRKDILLATYNEPVKKHETFRPVKIFKTPMGEQVIDFGQNLVGWVILKAKGNSGDKITLSHAEVLDKHGNFYIENLRAAKQQDV